MKRPPIEPTAREGTGKCKPSRSIWIALVAAVLAIGYIPPTALSARDVTALDSLPHIHGMAVDRADPRRLYLATHGGLYTATPEGWVTLVGDSADDLMGFAAHPSDEQVLYTSGHPPGGGNLGFLRSEDGGRTWTRLAEGVRGPVDFHAMDVSKADPNVIYGVFQGLQISRDGGFTWKIRGSAPNGIYDLAASAVDPARIYAATQNGLMLSTNAGETWQLAYLLKRPASMVHSAADGRVFAFVVGVGLVMTREPMLAWRTISTAFGDRVLLHFAADPIDPNRLYAVADTGAVVASKDGGRTWTSFEGSHRKLAPAVARGQNLYVDACQSCHGVRGVGERPDDMYAEDEYGFVAPPLDDSAHGWHHSDSNLVNTILNGSPRNERMIAWKEILSREDAEDLVAYIKSLWSFRSLACQGARHMSCMH